MTERCQEQKRQFRRRVFHLVIAVILIMCAISPFLETAAKWDNTIFGTGYDGETTVAVLVILLEVVVSFARPVVVCLCRNPEFTEPLVVMNPLVSFDVIFDFRISDSSPPPPLRI
ncbi:MAG TPA: hypothetical protein VFB23_02195 [Candidatus Acidoferrales bacterium]|nr:hypothetical protein [Candidatus Acidoferrales bacterium]